MTVAAPRGSGPVGVAVIGAGKISEQYLANMATYPDLAVRFLADLLPDRARQVADEYGVPAAGTMDEALARDDVEIIVNLTIPAAHADVASAALAAGKHVWNEKPLTVDRASGQALVAQADQAGLLLGCAPDTILGPGLQTALRMIARGDIGRPLTAAVMFQVPGPHWWHPNPEFLYQAGGGPLLDTGPYYVTTLTQIFGPITGVVARGASASPTRTIGQGPRAGEVFDVTVPSYITAIFQFAEDGVAQATFSFDSPLTRQGFVEIAGTEATLSLPDPNRFDGGTRLMKSRGTEWLSFEAEGVLGGRGVGAVDMARVLRGGGRHHATGQLGLHVLDAMLAAHESMESRGFVDVTSTFDPIEPLPAGWDPTEATM